MMTLRAETENFLGGLERFAGKKLLMGKHVGELLDLARKSGKMQVFEDLIFHAKFLSKSFDLMKRIGPDGEGYDKLSAEFTSGLEKADALTKTLVKESDESVKNDFTELFFHLNTEGLDSFMGLLRDLAWVKNWILDGKPLP